jgi:hypothetical protein
MLGDSKLGCPGRSEILASAQWPIDARKAIHEQSAAMCGGAAELAEIDANLIRCNLTSAQAAAAVTRCKAIYLELYPETAAGTAQAAAMNRARGRGQTDVDENSAFTSATSDATGKSRRSIEIAAARGKTLGDDLNHIAGTSLD